LSTAECLSLDRSVAASHHFLHMELLVTAIGAGLLVGLVCCLVKERVREPSAFALTGLAVILLGQISGYVYPFGLGLILGLAYDAFEEDWYGSAIVDSARASNRLRLFLKKSISQRLSSLLGSFRDTRAQGIRRTPREAHVLPGQ
jgi:xanthosine utilization system XapX-like protein